MLKRQDDSGKVTWDTHVKHILYFNGFGYVWITGEVGNIEQVMCLFSTRLKDCS